MSEPIQFPKIGDRAPSFDASTESGIVRFPAIFEGQWSILFAHPANFTGAWVMYSTFLALKEKYFTDRNAQLIGICSEPLAGEGAWNEKVKRYIGIYLKGPIVEDLDWQISGLYGLASGRRKIPGHDRAAYIIDPQGIIRHIIGSPFTLHSVVEDLEKNLNDLQGFGRPLDAPPDPKFLLKNQDRPDGPPTAPYRPKPAYFPNKEIGLN